MRRSSKQIRLLLSNKYLKTGRLLIACLFLFKNAAIAQANLIRNPSFENYTAPIDCNGGGFEIAGFPTFHHVVDNWYTFNSPDYFNSVCNVSTSYYNVPNSFFGTSYAIHGAAYGGIYIYNKGGETKEYIYQHLNAPLKQDSVYCLSFFATRADRIPYAVKTFGALFSVNIPTLITNYYINATPQVVNTTSFLTDTVNWQEIQGCFTAQGGEQYITIGNFNSNANTDTLRIQSANPLTGSGNEMAYYYIDSVTLWQNNFPTSIKERSNDGMVKVYPNPINSVISIKLAEGSLSIKNNHIKIVDVIGKEVLNENYKEELDISYLEKGIYFLSVYKDEELIGTKKVIKE